MNSLKEKNWKMIEGAIIIIILASMLIVVAYTSNIKSSMDNATIYSCNYHTLNFFRTVIDITKNDNDYATISGKIAKIVEDPLTMTDYNDVYVGKAGDEFHFVSQDSHSIIIGEETYIEMTGEFKVLGEEYTIYDSNQKVIGKVTFNLFGTKGVFSDNDGNIIAEYNSGWLRKDYTVTISNNFKINNDAILLIFASYASDFNFDVK